MRRAQKLENPWTIITLNHDKAEIKQGGKDRCEEEHRKAAKGNCGKKRKKAENCDHFMDDLCLTHGLRDFFPAVQLRIEKCRVIGRQIPLPLFDFQFFYTAAPQRGKADTNA